MIGGFRQHVIQENEINIHCMNNLKANIFLSIPYLTICGGLYHIAYWSTFNINGLSHLGISDLIKSFIYPFLSFTLTFLLGYILTTFFFTRKDRPPGGGRETSIGRFLNKKWFTFILVVLWIFIVIYLFSNGEKDRWIVWVIFAELTPTLFLFNIGLWREEIADAQLRFNLIQAFVLIPIISIATGKYDSELIKNNYRYKYVINTKIDSHQTIRNDTIKFLGSTETKLFFSDLKNTTTFIIRAESIDTIELKQFRQN